MMNGALHAALRSGKGCVRTNNEDAYFFNGSFAELKEMDLEASLAKDFGNSQSLFAICDGMGGYENGEVASYTAVSRMPELKRLLKPGNFALTLGQWVDETNKRIIEAARNGGCTLALLFFASNRVYAAHIGDSRIYLFQDGKLRRLTKDHSKVQVLLDAGIISEKEAETYPHKHVITRALGMDEEENGKCRPAIQDSLPEKNGDRYMICSDGVTDMLKDDQIGAILFREKTADDCAEAIYQAALNAGGKDNTSVIVIDVENSDESLEIKETSGLLESTWPPVKSPNDTIRIEQTTTIKQTNGQEITIKSLVSRVFL